LGRRSRRGVRDGRPAWRHVERSHTVVRAMRSARRRKKARKEKRKKETSSRCKWVAMAQSEKSRLGGWRGGQRRACARSHGSRSVAGVPAGKGRRWSPRRVARKLRQGANVSGAGHSATKGRIKVRSPDAPRDRASCRRGSAHSGTRRGERRSKEDEVPKWEPVVRSLRRRGSPPRRTGSGAAGAAAPTDRRWSPADAGAWVRRAAAATQCRVRHGSMP